MSTRDRKKDSGIPQGVVSRLPIYFRYLSELKSDNVRRVSSAQLGEALSITAAQIRSDLSYFGSFGQQGYGYRVDELLEQVSSILGLSNPYQLILIGAGNLGRALASYGNFRSRGFEIKAIFDSNPLLEGNFLAGCVIQPAERLEDYLKENTVDIAVISTPKDVSQGICDQLTNNGVKGIWNFSPVHLQVSDDVLVEHTHLTDSLLRLSFRLQERNKGSYKESMDV